MPAGLFCERIRHPLGDPTPLHAHAEGQLFWLRDGALIVHEASGRSTFTAGQTGWIPAGMPHWTSGHGRVDGWACRLDTPFAPALPDTACRLEASSLLPALLERLASDEPQGDARNRLVGVLLDEIVAARKVQCRLPYPAEARLRRLADALIATPGDTRTLAQWALFAGVSERSLSRRFPAETGMTFERWRHAARLDLACTRLARGETVQDVAHALGYSTASAFISAFRKAFGIPPGQYGRLTHENQPDISKPE
ncbi:helix-turn-helix transcriptional regulator [Paludibacterium paludis]|uniref:AraC family transcriptional regulator n=1 Tax=Paludibacterium paludis TaxID=1225769 RepID=A0A918P2J4_9NEIS|nr:AraC family transcriptional regulator [Paludibacterium paludis]GGY14114.1 AraC family transcriptional regulator [Paludibacterium paludis]